MEKVVETKEEGFSGGRPRIASIDTFRGIVMFLMLAEILHLPRIRQIFYGDDWTGKVADWIRFHTTHVEWAGGSLHDMIQPGFTFLVGCSMAFSLVARAARGESRIAMFKHAVVRSIILVLLGILLRSLGKPITNFTFDDTLTQIGMGYWALFLVAQCSTRTIIGILAAILIGYWGMFVAYPAPTPDFPYQANGVPESWKEFYTNGFAVHFNKNSNLAWAFDRWWMNLFPRESPFLFSGGGYSTLSFIPTLGTMILGLLAGQQLQSFQYGGSSLRTLIASGVLCMTIGWGLDATGICPIVKRIWTPSWTLWSGGICFLALAALHWITDLKLHQKWAFPFLVIGANSIVAYVMSWTLEKPVMEAFKRHIGVAIDWVSATIGKVFGVQGEQVPMINEMILGGLTLGFFWLVLYWLYKKKIFVRI